jgi:hypothetical protein
MIDESSGVHCTDRLIGQGKGLVGAIEALETMEPSRRHYD